MSEEDRARAKAKARLRLSKQFSLTHESIQAEEGQKLQQEEVKKARVLKAEEMGMDLFPLNYGKKLAMGAGTLLDYFGGAPTRAGIKAGAEGGLFAGLKAFGSQYGKMPSESPTGKDIATETFGLSTSTEGTQPKPSWFPSPAGLAGGAIDVLGDWTNVVPVGKVVKGALGLGGKIAGAGVGMGAKATDIATGTGVATKTRDVARAGFDEMAERFKQPFTSKESPDWGMMEDIAKRNNIDAENLPAAVKYGKGSFKSRLERVKAEGPEGEKLLKAHEESVFDVNRAVEKEIRGISGGTRPMDNIQGGAMLRDKFDNHVNTVFDDIVETYDHVMVGNPGLMIEDVAFTKMDGVINQIRRSASRDVKRGSSDATRSSGKQILRNIDMIEKGSGSYKQTLESLRDIGKDAFSSTNPAMVGPDKKAMQKLYFALRDGLTETADHVNPNLGQQLRLNNEKLSELIGEKNTLSKLIQSKNLSDEQVFKSVLGNSQNINALKKFYNDDELKQIKGSFINGLLKEDIEGKISFRGAFNTLRNKKDIANTLFKGDELKNFNELLLFGDRLGLPVMSTSGTGATSQFIGALKDIPSRTFDKMVEKGIEKTAKPAGKSLFNKIVKSPRSKALQVLSVQDRNKDDK